MQISNKTITDGGATVNVLEVTNSFDGSLSYSVDDIIPWEEATGLSAVLELTAKGSVSTDASIQALGNVEFIEIGTSMQTLSIPLGGYSDTRVAFDFATDDTVYIKSWKISGNYVSTEYTQDDPEEEEQRVEALHPFEYNASIQTSAYTVEDESIDPPEYGSISSAEGGLLLESEGKDVAKFGETSTVGELFISDTEGVGTVTETKVISSYTLAPFMDTVFPVSDVNTIVVKIDGVQVTPSNVIVNADGTVTVVVTLSSAPRGDELMSVTYSTDSVMNKYFTFGDRAEGRNAGPYSTAIGMDVVADGVGAFAQGKNAEATGMYSRSFGVGTRARRERETVIGSYNAETVTDMLFVIGNGYSDDNRSNAFAVDWAGNAVAKNIDQGWIPATITKASAVTSVTNLEAYKHNGLMHLAFTVRATVPAGSWTTIATVGGGTKYRPANDTYTYGGVTSRPIGIRVTSAGSVQVYTSTAINDNILYGSIQYPASSDIVDGTL